MAVATSVQQRRMFYEFPVRINLESRLFAVRCDEDLVVPAIAESQPKLQLAFLRLSAIIPSTARTLCA